MGVTPSNELFNISEKVLYLPESTSSLTTQFNSP
jgi:hypothetical protein